MRLSEILSAATVNYVHEDDVPEIFIPILFAFSPKNTIGGNVFGRASMGNPFTGQPIINARLNSF